MTTYTIYHNDNNGKRVTVDICPSLARAKDSICSMIDYQLCGELSQDDKDGRARLAGDKARLLTLTDEEFEAEMSTCGQSMYDVDTNGYLLINSLDCTTYYIDAED